jgi:hypothetical protein
MTRRAAAAPKPSATRERLGTRDKDVIVTTIALPRQLHMDLWIVAKRLNWTFTKLAKEALAEWMDRYQSRQPDARGAR